MLSAVSNFMTGVFGSRNQRLINGQPAAYDSPTVMVGGAEAYEARCRACHAVAHPQGDQLSL